MEESQDYPVHAEDKDNPAYSWSQLFMSYSNALFDGAEYCVNGICYELTMVSGLVLLKTVPQQT